MSDRYFDQAYREADGLLSRSSVKKLAKAMDSRSFGDEGRFTVDALIDSASDAAIQNTALARVAKEIGHPRYSDLELGDVQRANAIVLFMDVRGFTRLSIELENEELIRILQKLSIASVATVYHRGGFIGDFTGDGIMAFFDGANSVTGALQTAAELLAGVRDVVNPALKRDGDTGVRVAVGMEFGEVCWTRIGYAGISQVKPVSEVTYVAGKLATREHTEKWQCCIGEQLATVVPEQLTKRVKGIPYSNGSGEQTYQVFDLDWEQFDRLSAYDPAALLKKISSGGLKTRPRAPLATASTLSVPAVIRSSSIAGPGDAPVPPRNRQVG